MKLVLWIVASGLLLAQNPNPEPRAGAAPAPDRRAMLLRYQNAWFLLNRLASENPNDPQIRRELLAIGYRVRALGGTIPVWIPGPIGAEPEPEPSQAVARRPPVVFEVPKTGQCRDALDQYSIVAASGQGAIATMDALRASVEGRGLSLRADYDITAARLVGRVEVARRMIEQGECASAVETLKLAEADSSRLLKALGQ